MYEGDEPWQLIIECPFCGETLVDTVDFDELEDYSDEIDVDEIADSTDCDPYSCEHTAFYAEAGFGESTICEDWKDEVRKIAGLIAAGEDEDVDIDNMSIDELAGFIREVFMDDYDEDSRIFKALSQLYPKKNFEVIFSPLGSGATRYYLYILIKKKIIVKGKNEK